MLDLWWFYMGAGLALGFGLGYWAPWLQRNKASPKDGA